LRRKSVKMNVEVSLVRCYGGEDGEGMRLCVRAKGSRSKIVEVRISGIEHRCFRRFGMPKEPGNIGLRRDGSPWFCWKRTVL
jgi:hypothetical protein